MAQKNAIAVDVRRLPPTVTVSEAAGLLRISRHSAYEGVRAGQIPVVKIGHRLLVPTARLLQLLEGAPLADGEGSGR